MPFLGALAGCSARRSERRVASHTSEEQRRNAPGSAAKNGILAISASLSGCSGRDSGNSVRQKSSFKNKMQKSNRGSAVPLRVRCSLAELDLIMS